MSGWHPEAPIPGGFGACGGPNDGWHQALHSLTKSFLQQAVNWSNSPAQRLPLDQMQMNVQTTVSTKQLG